MSSSSIAVVGLGPGRRALLTVEALETLCATERLYLHAEQQPMLAELRGDLRPHCQVATVEDGAADDVVATLLATAAEGPLTYAVAGHPLAHDTVRVLLARAAERGVETRIIAGLSQLDGALPPDAVLTDGVQIVAAAALLALDGDAQSGLSPLWTGQSGRLLNAQAPLLVTGIRDEQMLAAVARRLLERYPAAHEVTLTDGASARAPLTLPLGDLDSIAKAHNAITAHYLGTAGFPPASGGRREASGPRFPQPQAPVTLHVPPLAALDDARALNTLGYITARLRGPGGCPWDREQTHASLTTFMIEEAYEAVDAIERDDTADMVEELGDVLLQVVLHSQLAEEEGRFSLADVAEEVNRKLVRRHPHVFGDVTADTSSEVLRNWERIKRAEKGERRASALDGIPLALPALALAQTVGRKAAKHGFDWPDVQGTLDKAREEMDEIARATSDAERRDEVGDLLFALTSACRHLGIDAEDALRAAVRKFSLRFRRVEALAAERGLDLAALSLPALDALWEEAKAGGRDQG